MGLEVNHGHIRDLEAFTSISTEVRLIDINACPEYEKELVEHIIESAVVGKPYSEHYLPKNWMEVYMKKGESFSIELQGFVAPLHVFGWDEALRKDELTLSSELGEKMALTNFLLPSTSNGRNFTELFRSIPRWNIAHRADGKNHLVLISPEGSDDDKRILGDLISGRYLENYFSALQDFLTLMRSQGDSSLIDPLAYVKYFNRFRKTVEIKNNNWGISSVGGFRKEVLPVEECIKFEDFARYKLTSNEESNDFLMWSYVRKRIEQVYGDIEIDDIPYTACIDQIGDIPIYCCSFDIDPTSDFYTISIFKEELINMSRVFPDYKKYFPDAYRLVVVGEDESTIRGSFNLSEIYDFDNIVINSCDEEKDIRRIVRHELTHKYFVAKYGPNTHRITSEGLAEYYGSYCMKPDDDLLKIAAEHLVNHSISRDKSEINPYLIGPLYIQYLYNKGRISTLFQGLSLAKEHEVKIHGITIENKGGEISSKLFESEYEGLLLYAKSLLS